jgi:hypothetical protein
MMRRALLAAALIAAVSGTCGIAGSQETTWESPSIDIQLQMDDVIIPVGKGAVFVPSMTDPENEPVCGVLSEDRIVQSSKTGHRIPLAPGTYTVVWGSGTKDQMMQKVVEVVEGSTTVIKPDWSGLVIDVINESRLDIREYYELLDLSSGVSYGIGQGIEEGLDEKLRTWTLPPGIYKVVKTGDNVNTVINFGTIRLLPGELVHTNLVIDSKTGNFLGFGVISDVRQGQKFNTKWERRSELSGNALLNYTPSNVTGQQSNSNFTSTVQWLTDARYESKNHIIPLWSNIEEGLSVQGKKNFQKYIDHAELRLTYIYRLTDYINPYMWFSTETSLFKTFYQFDNPSTYSVLGAAGDTVRVVKDASKIKLSGPLSPILFKEGFGVTSTLWKSVPLNLDLRSGYGARQNYARGAYVYNKDTKVLVPVVKTSLTGMELLLLGDMRIGRYILFTTQLDLLMPKIHTSSWVYDGENRLRLNLTGNVSLLFTFDFNRDQTLKRNISSYQTLLRFSKFL